MGSADTNTKATRKCVTVDVSWSNKTGHHTFWRETFFPVVCMHISSKTGLLPEYPVTRARNWRSFRPKKTVALAWTWAVLFLHSAVRWKNVTSFRCTICDRISGKLRMITAVSNVIHHGESSSSKIEPFLKKRMSCRHCRRIAMFFG